MTFNSYPKSLEWEEILHTLASFCHCEAAKAECLELSPKFTREEILERWEKVLSLKELAILGYRAPVGEISPIEQILQSAEIGRILEPTDLLLVKRLLDSLQQVIPFIRDLIKKSSALASIAPFLDPLPKLRKALVISITPEGKIADTASKLLEDLRREKIDLKRKIEQKLANISKDLPWVNYIQDDFYTVRHERYVLPLRLDARGRVLGSVVDISASGQTLYIEPASVAAMNQQLSELELSERLEILRILKDLTAKTLQESLKLTQNFTYLVYLDVLSAEAQWALQYHCGKAEISAEPILDLVRARHPLIGGKGAVANSISLKKEQHVLILSGPNAGGKTVVLKTIGIVHLLAKARLLLPVAQESQIFLFENIFVEIGDQQNILANLSTFSGHIEGIKPILKECGAKDLVLLDELASGTEPRTGCALARSITEYIAQQGAFVVITSHFDDLKTLPSQDKKFRVASLEYDLKNRKPTYRLILDVPGQSYGIELANALELPIQVIKRAYELKGSETTMLDQTIEALSLMQKDLQEQNSVLTKEIDALALEKARWEQEKILLANTRRELAEKLKSKYAAEFNEFKEKILEELEQTKNLATQSEAAKQHFFWAEAKSKLEKNASNYSNTQEQLIAKDSEKISNEIDFKSLSLNQKIFVIPLKRTALIKKLGASASEPIEVESQMMRIKVKLKDLAKI